MTGQEAPIMIINKIDNYPHHDRSRSTDNDNKQD